MDLSNQNVAIVVFVHSPLTLRILEAWLDQNQIDPKRLVVLYFRIPTPRIPCRVAMKLPAITYGFWDRIPCQIAAVRFAGKVRQSLGGQDYLLVSPHLLETSIRLLAAAKQCRGYFVYEEGILSYDQASESIRARGLSPRLIDIMTSFRVSASKLKGSFSLLPIAFPGSPKNDLVKVKLEEIPSSMEACILISEEYDFLGLTKGLLNRYREWAIHEIRSRGMTKVGLRFHPDFESAPDRKQAQWEIWSQGLSGLQVESVNYGLDFMRGDGRLLLGFNSSLLLYAEMNGWEVRMPAGEEFLGLDSVRLTKNLLETIRAAKFPRPASN